mmetsp:Transcript_52168/g.113640  ORF Transcript_52168/g.113640 Transcript_52168/m.113640 type:complete len:260 (+) Transcript_52168:215-994(+)
MASATTACPTAWGIAAWALGADCSEGVGYLKAGCRSPRTARRRCRRSRLRRSSRCSRSAAPPPRAAPPRARAQTRTEAPSTATRTGRRTPRPPVGPITTTPRQASPPGRSRAARGATAQARPRPPPPRSSDEARACEKTAPLTKPTPTPISTGLAAARGVRLPPLSASLSSLGRSASPARCSRRFSMLPATQSKTPCSMRAPPCRRASDGDSKAIATESPERGRSLGRASAGAWGRGRPRRRGGEARLCACVRGWVICR